MSNPLYSGVAMSQAERNELYTLYHVSPPEWEASEAQWRARRRALPRAVFKTEVAGAG